MKHSYSDATTKRFIKWYVDIVGNEHEPPTFRRMFDWLRDAEEYRSPLNAMRNLCVGLREAGEPRMLQWIANVAIYELEDEYQFSDTAERFFNAMVRRCGVDDTEVNMYDKHARVGTLHDLGLAKMEKTDARPDSR